MYAILTKKQLQAHANRLGLDASFLTDLVETIFRPLYLQPTALTITPDDREWGATYLVNNASAVSFILPKPPILGIGFLGRVVQLGAGAITFSSAAPLVGGLTTQGIGAQATFELLPSGSWLIGGGVA